MSQITDLSIAILAGGRSTRFGYPKIYANFRGKSLIQACIDNSNKISNSVFIITGESSQLTFNQVKSYPDIFPGSGPLGGIYTALEIAQTPLIAIMPTDMPLLQPNTYQRLYHNMVDQRPMVAMCHNQIQPLVSIWPKRLSKNLQYFLFDHQTNVQEVLRKLDVQKYYMTPEPLEFLNINTREDYQILLQSSLTE